MIKTRVVITTGFPENPFCKKGCGFDEVWIIQQDKSLRRNIGYLSPSDAGFTGRSIQKFQRGMQCHPPPVSVNRASMLRFIFAVVPFSWQRSLLPVVGRLLWEDRWTSQPAGKQTTDRKCHVPNLFRRESRAGHPCIQSVPGIPLMKLGLNSGVLPIG